MPNTAPTTMASANAIANARARPLDRSAASTANTAHGDEQLGPEQHAPAERPEQPLPEEQEQADEEEEGDEDEAEGGEPAEGERPQDLALDLVRPRPSRGRCGRGRPGSPRRASACSWAIRPDGGSGGRPRAVRVGPIGIQGSSSAEWACVRETAPTIAAPDGRTRRVRSRHGRCNRVSIARRGPGGPLVAAELLAIGTELTVGETTDTNSGELARSLVALGVTVVRISNLPDDLARRRRRAAHRARPCRPRRDHRRPRADARRPHPRGGRRGVRRAARGRPGDARLAARAVGASPSAVPRGQHQAGVDPAVGQMLANPNGTAPGWWVDRPDGRVIVTLPGPPREMRPMWANEVQPRLAARGVGVETEVRTLRLTGIGESQVAELPGRATAPGNQPDRRDLRAPGGGRRAHLRPRPRRGGRPATSPTKPRPSCSRRWASSSGRAATRHGRARSPRRSTRAAGRSRRPRPGPAARSSACCAGSRRFAGPRSSRDPGDAEPDARDARRGPRPRRGGSGPRRPAAPTWGCPSARSRRATTRPSTSGS